MEYQKIINLSDNTPIQPPELKTKNCVEIYDESRETYEEENQIRFNTSMLRSRLCDYSNAYILAKETVAVANIPAANNSNKKVIF